jgi:hypothetical protein
MKAYKVLSIDAWGNSDEGYEWNNWFNVGNITLDIDANKQAILEAMHNAGFITNVTSGDVDDDGYNLVIVDKATTEPLFAIEYGSTI